MRRAQDKVHAPHANVPKCAELGLILFLHEIVHSTKFDIQDNLLNTLLIQIQLERSGEIINRSAMRDAIDIMSRLSAKVDGRRETKTVYAMDFESKFLRRSEEFYKNESEGLLESCDAATYLRRVSRSVMGH